MVGGKWLQRWCLWCQNYLNEWSEMNGFKVWQIKIVGEWVKFYEYEIKLGQHKIWISKSFELDNEGGSGIIGTLQI